MATTSFIMRDEFCRDLAATCGVGLKDSVEFSSMEEVYDLVFTQLATYLQTGTTRVYLPRIGTLYRSIVPENPSAGLPERLRYRLSCKPFLKQ